MKVLHICNDFSYSKVHTNLYAELDKIGVLQTIYHPLRDKKHIGNNLFPFMEKDSKVIYSKFLLKLYHRVFFKLKVNSIFKDLEQQVDLSKVDIQYPTTLFSDGAVAYKIFRKYKIPYIVAVRNTDVNLFFKYRKDLIPLARKILFNASKIIFLSKGLKDTFFSHKAFSLDILESRVVLVNNGIDNFWLDNKKPYEVTRGKKIMFVGRFDRNKNAENLIKALMILKKKYNDIELNLVGGDGNNVEAINRLIKDNKDWIFFHGKILDKQELLKIYRNNDYFAMPSIHETFGLVYIESLSQGIPVLYTKGQGIDNNFIEKVGVASGTSVIEIIEALELLFANQWFEINELDFEKFRWKTIAKFYRNVFEECR